MQRRNYISSIFSLLKYGEIFSNTQEKYYFIGAVAPSGPPSSGRGTRSHLKCSPQLNPPRTTGDELYASVSALMISITGHTTVCRSSRMTASKGCSHITFTSQWLSRNTKTSPKEANNGALKIHLGLMMVGSTHCHHPSCTSIVPFAGFSWDFIFI